MLMKKVKPWVTKTKLHSIFHLKAEICMLKGLVLRAIFRRKPCSKRKRFRLEQLFWGVSPFRGVHMKNDFRGLIMGWGEPIYVKMKIGGQTL